MDQITLLEEELYNSKQTQLELIEQLTKIGIRLKMLEMENQALKKYKKMYEKLQK